MTDTEHADAELVFTPLPMLDCMKGLQDFRTMVASWLEKLETAENRMYITPKLLNDLDTFVVNVNVNDAELENHIIKGCNSDEWEEKANRFLADVESRYEILVEQAYPLISRTCL